MQNISEEEIDAAINRMGKLTEKEFLDSYTKETKKQHNIFYFLAESAELFGLQKDSINSMMELCYNVLTIYKDKYTKKIPTVKSDTILYVLADRQKIEEERAAILGIDLNDDDAQEKLYDVYEDLRKEIEKDADAAEKGIYKKLFEFEQKQEEGAAYVLNFCSYFIENDEISAEEDKASISSLIEVVVKSLEKEINGNKRK
jgi:hypothetical protein